MAKSKGYPHNIKPGSPLARIGFWATVWWAVSCLYVLLIVWLALVEIGGFGFRIVFAAYPYLYWLLAIIIVGWVAGAIVWFRELRKAKVPYRVALKDLFLTVRK